MGNIECMNFELHVLVSSFSMIEMDAARCTCKEQTRERVRSYREKQTQSQREHRRERKRIAERCRQETGVRRSQRLLAMRQEAQKRSTEETPEQR